MSTNERCSRFPANFCDDGERLPGDPRWKPSRRGFATSCCRHGYALRVVDVGYPTRLLCVDVECEGAPRFDEPFEPYLARAVPR